MSVERSMVEGVDRDKFNLAVARLLGFTEYPCHGWGGRTVGMWNYPPAFRWLQHTTPERQLPDFLAILAAKLGELHAGQALYHRKTTDAPWPPLNQEDQ